jgi:peroxiredoxin family protein
VNKYNFDKLTNEFILNAMIHEETTYSGNYKKGNKASDKLNKICKLMKENASLAEKMLDILLKHDNINVRIWACGTAIDIKYKEDEAKQILTDISKMTNIGIQRFNAEMSLKVRMTKLK